MTTPAPRPLYLDVAPDPVFGVFHAPAEDSATGTAVLICPPWGWNDVTSYRARREWAERLAADGHAALRFDLPSTGDSGGGPRDGGRLDAWTGAVAGAVAWLRAGPGISRVAVIGLGLGGLVAAKAISEGTVVDDLVLWSAPARGKSLVRAERAFAGLQSSRYNVGEESEPMLPEGWLEIGGFVLSAETIAALEGLSFGPVQAGSVRRALLLARDGIAPDAAIGTVLEAAGAEVTVVPGDGWEAMCFHPERYDPPHAVFDRVGAWLAGSTAGDVGGAGADDALARAVAVPDSGSEVTLDVAGVAVRESALTLDGPAGRLFGILAEPAGGRFVPPPFGAVFLNAGAVRRIGPNRMWVDIARHWASRGIPTLRIDIEGIGDSDGDALRFVDVGEFYEPRIGLEVRAFLDALGSRGVSRFVLAGLCAGAYWAFHAAAEDERVIAVYLLNARALSWDGSVEQRRQARRLKRLAGAGTWRRILRGGIDRERMATLRQAVGSAARVAVDSVMSRFGGRSRPERHEDRIAATLGRLRESSTSVLLAFSDDEPLDAELVASGVIGRAAEWPNLRLARLPSSDHTLRPMVAQKAAADLLDRALDETLAQPARDPATVRRDP